MWYRSLNDRKKNLVIYYSLDWYQLVRRTGKANMFQLIEISQFNLYDFASLLKEPLMVHKLNIEREKFKWLEVSWLQYQKSEKVFSHYINTLERNKPFKIWSFHCRGNNGKLLHVKEKYLDPLLISNEKKRITRYAISDFIISIVLSWFENNKWNIRQWSRF